MSSVAVSPDYLPARMLNEFVYCLAATLKPDAEALIIWQNDRIPRSNDRDHIEAGRLPIRFRTSKTLPRSNDRRLVEHAQASSSRHGDDPIGACTAGFGAASSTNIGVSPRALVAGDLNGDGTTVSEVRRRRPNVSCPVRPRISTWNRGAQSPRTTFAVPLRLPCYCGNSGGPSPATRPLTRECYPANVG
jgi:hypothetical protein